MWYFVGEEDLRAMLKTSLNEGNRIMRRPVESHEAFVGDDSLKFQGRLNRVGQAVPRSISFSLCIPVRSFCRGQKTYMHSDTGTLNNSRTFGINFVLCA